MAEQKTSWNESKTASGGKRSIRGSPRISTGVDHVEPLKSQQPKHSKYGKLKKQQGAPREQKTASTDVDSFAKFNKTNTHNKKFLKSKYVTAPNKDNVLNPDYVKILQDIHAGKSNSTSTVYATSTISAPCLEEIVLSVSTALQCQIVMDASDIGRKMSEELFQFFMENQYFLDADDMQVDEYKSEEGKVANEGKSGDCGYAAGESGRKRRKLKIPIPPLSDIFNFYVKICKTATTLNPECLIVSLIYVNRLIANTGMPLHASNWKPLCMCAVVLAQKMWDDNTLGYRTFADILPNYDLDSSKFNMLETRFLQLLDYDVMVDTALYAQYYFELRALGEPYGNRAAQIPLNKVAARRLEMRSRTVSQSFETQRQNLRLRTKEAW